MATLAHPIVVASVTGGKRHVAVRRSASPAVPRRSTVLRAVGPDGEWISVRDTIQEKINAELAPTVLVVNDDSEKHANHKGMHDGHAGVRSNESHFSVVVVAEAFQGMTPIKRHRMVNAILQKEFDDGLHALQLSTKTPAEYEKSNK